MLRYYLLACDHCSAKPAKISNNMDLKQVRNLSQTKKDSVFGYIRKAQSSFWSTETINCNIPQIIAYLVSLYLYLFDYFVALYFHLNEYFELNDVSKISNDQLSFDGKDIKELRRYHTAFGCIRINNTVNWRKCMEI